VYDTKRPVRVVTAIGWRALPRLASRHVHSCIEWLKGWHEEKRVCRQQNAQLASTQDSTQLRPILVEGCLCRIGKIGAPVYNRATCGSNVTLERCSRNAIIRGCWSRGLNLQKARHDRQDEARPVEREPRPVKYVSRFFAILRKIFGPTESCGYSVVCGAAS